MNPFRYGQVVSNKDFCERAELKYLVDFIKSGQNVFIQGERRIGKTSLICEAVRRTRNTRLLYIDLLAIKSTTELCKRIVKALLILEQKSGVFAKLFQSLAQLRPTFTLDPVTGQPSITLNPSVNLPPDSLEQILNMAKTAHKNRPLVVVFDEFQDILNIKDADEALAVMRSKIQFQGDIPYFFAGSVRNKMADIFSNPESAFFKSAILLDVGLLNREKFIKYLYAKFATGKRTIEADTVNEIFKIAGEIPGDVQQLCAALWEISSYKEHIGKEKIQEAVNLIFTREIKGYEFTISQLSAQQLKCLTGLARSGGSAPFSKKFLQETGVSLPASVKKALNRLQSLRIIYRIGNNYKFVNPFFKYWVNIL